MANPSAVKLKVVTPFAFYHDGVTRTEYAAGVHDIPAAAAAVALKEKWAVPPTKKDLEGEGDDKEE